MDIWTGLLIYEICFGIGLLLLPFYSEWSMRRAFRIPDDKIWIYPGMTMADFVDEVELKIEQGYIDKDYFGFIDLGDKNV
jgi:hypothetical protein